MAVDEGALVPRSLKAAGRADADPAMLLRAWDPVLPKRLQGLDPAGFVVRVEATLADYVHPEDPA